MVLIQSYGSQSLTRDASAVSPAVGIRRRSASTIGVRDQFEMPVADVTLGKALVCHE